MTALALLVLGAAIVLIYSAVTNQSIADELRAALGG